MKIKLLSTFVLMGCAVGAMAQTGGYIAGLHPDRRPDTAPQVTEAARTPEQLAHALYGIEKPIPGNVELIAATGNWWVPLRHPGMTGPYDLRGWHDANSTTADVSASTAPAAAASAR